MTIDVSAVRKCLRAFDFNTLFREHLGWDSHKAHVDIPINGDYIRLAAVAQKRGFVAFQCSTIPDRPTRLKIDRQVTKSAREHFIIYTDEAAGRQVWQWVRREAGKPLASRDHHFDVTQSGDPLIQRLGLIAVSLDEEEGLTLPDVTGRIRSALDVDKVTKKFYDRFKKEHAAFLKCITGLKADADLQWYTSIMLNRLMFVYFIQKKGFLDNDVDYLKNRLVMVEEARGKDEFQSFYQYFLLRLFHDGLGKSPDKRKLDKTMEELLGKVPFLNGGFFEVHQLEEHNPGIDIPDVAFRTLFDFFDQYCWHLDERPLRADNEINPDVVGYIFEKYINQKEMGAYYTKEDITGYISKNTIIPFLFDVAENRCAIAFQSNSALWRLLCDDPDRYIYPATRHGIIDEAGGLIPLPEHVAAGLKDVTKRDSWNQPAEDIFALETETWREHVARRQQCLAVREQLQEGMINNIHELITLNLDIWQFARDAIVNTEGPELLRAFWTAIQGITILDPTCGSGAFLFSALHVLETLYSDCLERMERFIDDAKNSAPSSTEQQIRVLIAAGESETVEFKSSARWDVKENQHNPVLEQVIVKTVAGFLNGHGGTLLIGVSDCGVILGLEKDYRRTRKQDPNRDQFELWLTTHLVNKLGNEFKPYFHIDFAVVDGGDVCRVSVYRSPGPAFVENKGVEILYVRQGNATRSYSKSSEVLAYKEQHWSTDRPVAAPPPPPSALEIVAAGKDANSKRAYDDFRKTLAQIDKHPNERYFIMKSIIINNLFGVDIMEEAIEICKLRLFLKLVAQVGRFEQIEPLPDIDFNIKAGNTLVGFASFDEVKQSMEGDWVRLQSLPQIEEEAELVDGAFQEYRIQQTTHESGGQAANKLELRGRLAKLNHVLTCYVAEQYGIKINQQKSLESWIASHKPFHWFVEFYGIMQSGGFDVVIGNPPYLELRQVDYVPRLLETCGYGAIHAMCIERSYQLLRTDGTASMIVPLALVSTQRMTIVQQLIEKKASVWYANFAWRPGKLFDTVNRALTIFIACRMRERPCNTYSTNYQKWNSATRHDLFPKMGYCEIDRDREVFWAPKLGDGLEKSILSKVRAAGSTVSFFIGKSTGVVYYRTTGGLYWKVFTDFAPEFERNGESGRSSRQTSFSLSKASHVHPAVAVLSSDLFWWWYTITSNLRDLNPSDIRGFPIAKGAFDDEAIALLGHKYIRDLKKNSSMLVREQKQTGTTKTQSFKVQKSKSIINEIDRVLAKHYGLTDEEVDFIINYDIKYRIGVGS